MRLVRLCQAFVLTNVLTMTVLASVASAQVGFFDMSDATPNRCFSVPKTVVDGDSLNIGFESGYSSTTWTSNAFIASTRSFYARAAADTINVSITAPPGARLTRITYNQAGNRLIERSNYWSTSGTGSLTINGVAHPLNFVSPTLTKTVDLSAQNVSAATVSIQVSLRAYRNSNFPRVTAAPGSATISVTQSILSVEYE